MDQLMAPVSPGELLDKITILEIKSERISDPQKNANVRTELNLLNAIWAEGVPAEIDLSAQRAALKAVNEKLWVIEDDIREEERAKRFEQRFIDLARSVYVTNDERARIKKEINLALGSVIVEEKSYSDYA
nr:hypothetical protein [Oceanococcus sp. HetDA_MAG_MS8]